ncbi:MAG: hypothetical protein J6Q84_07450 [Kiritimatiellae bacterium]|nr:hypothetical protein [Kiritimatiellia bacterium]
MTLTEEDRDWISALFSGSQERAEYWFRKIYKQNLAQQSEMKILRHIIRSGEQLEFPWFKLSGARLRQVEAVIAYLKEHSNREIYTLPRACRETFKFSPDGYPTHEALAAYCYRVKLQSFID